MSVDRADRPSVDQRAFTLAPSAGHVELVERLDAQVRERVRR